MLVWTKYFPYNPLMSSKHIQIFLTQIRSKFPMKSDRRLSTIAECIDNVWQVVFQISVTVSWLLFAIDQGGRVKMTNERPTICRMVRGQGSHIKQRSLVFSQVYCLIKVWGSYLFYVFKKMRHFPRKKLFCWKRVLKIETWIFIIYLIS